jgi:hypothetical protein
VPGLALRKPCAADLLSGAAEFVERHDLSALGALGLGSGLGILTFKYTRKA